MSLAYALIRTTKIKVAKDTNTLKLEAESQAPEFDMVLVNGKSLSEWEYQFEGKKINFSDIVLKGGTVIIKQFENMRKRK